MTLDRRSAAAAVAVVFLGGVLFFFLRDGRARSGDESSPLTEGRVKTPSEELDAAAASEAGYAEEATSREAAPRESTRLRASEEPASKRADGEPLGHVQLECRALDSSETPLAAFRALLAREQAPAEQELAENGAVLYRGLTPGRFTLCVQAIGFQDYREEIEIPSTPSRIVKTVHLELDEQVVFVNLLTPDGKRVDTSFAAGKGDLFDGPVRVIATRDPLEVATRVAELAGEECLVDSVMLVTRTILRSGRRPLQPEYSGYLHVSMQRPFFASLTIGNSVTRCIPVDRGVKVVTFVLDRDTLAAKLARVKLRVVDEATKEPVKGARVGLHKFSMVPGNYSRYLSTDKFGVANFELVSVGEVLLDIASRTGVADARILETRAGEILDLGDVSVHPFVGVAVEGRVVDVFGEPVESQVILTPKIEWRAGSLTGSGRFQSSTENGLFRLANVQPGTYSAWAMPQQGLLGPVAQEVVVSKDGVSNLVLTARAGNAFLAHLDEKNPVPTFIVVKDGTGQRLVQCLLGRDAPRLKGNLAAGSYTIETYNAAGQGPTIPFTVGAAPVDLTIR